MTETIRRVMTSLGVLDNPEDRLEEIRARLQELEADETVTWASHGEEATRLIEEGSEIQRAVDRARKVAHVRRAAADPANMEDGADHSSGVEAPSYVPQLGRAETAAEVVRRAGNPWRGSEGMPLGSPATYGIGIAESGAGLIARAHTALEALEGTLTRDGCERLAQAMAEQTGWPGVTIKRSKEEQAQAAELWLALSDPHYAEAFRSVLRFPGEFTGAGGTGFETLTNEQRESWRTVRTNELCRTAFNEASGAGGAFAIPLDLHPDVILTNSGSANPFRKVARTVLATTNVAEFVTSPGATANWLAEGIAVTDTTPTLGQLSITHYKEAVWIYGSFEVLQDSQLGEQVPALIADAKDRLEVAAFTTGSGSGTPFGVITHGTSDATVGVLTSAMVYALHSALPPRFRSGPDARPVWMANVSVMNALRQLAAFTGAVTPILSDSGGGPSMVGLPVYENSAMDASNATSGHKNLVILDANSYVITSRQPELLIYEPLVKSAASGLPTGQAGWFSWSRTGADLTTATAAQYHTT